MISFNIFLLSWRETGTSTWDFYGWTTWTVRTPSFYPYCEQTTEFQVRSVVNLKFWNGLFQPISAHMSCQLELSAYLSLIEAGCCYLLVCAASWFTSSQYCASENGCSDVTERNGAAFFFFLPAYLKPKWLDWTWIRLHILYWTQKLCCRSGFSKLTWDKAEEGETDVHFVQIYEKC